MPSRIRTIASPGSRELVVKKSRFICSLERVESEEDARSKLSEFKRTYWDASHNCSAWVIGENGESQRSNDDGEPSGTAGAPILNVLNQRMLTDILAIVTRYFGGTLLGSGGLIRAYGQAVSDTIDQVGVIERRLILVTEVRASHQDAGRIENAVRNSHYHLAGIDYSTKVTFTLHLAESDVSDFAEWIAETSAGQYTPTVVGKQYAEFRVSR